MRLIRETRGPTPWASSPGRGSRSRSVPGSSLSCHCPGGGGEFGHYSHICCVRSVLGSHQPIDRDDTRTDRSLDDDCSHIMYLPTILIRIDYIHLGFPYIEYLCALLKRFSESPLQISYLWTWNNKKLTKKGL